MANIFLDKAPKSLATEGKIDKLGYIKLRSCCIVSETVNRMNRQPEEC
jgi:hypothetical protein